MLIQKMFEPILSRMPRNRSELVNDLEIPDIPLEPYIWDPPEDLLEPTGSDVSGSIEELRPRAGTVTTDSDMPLSRAMTDSEIDYDRYKRIKSRRLSDPFGQMREALNRFPQYYLDSLSSFQTRSSNTTSTSTLTDDFEELRLYTESLRRFNEDRRRYSEELHLKMERFFDDECLVFTPDDPGLLSLEEALQSLDLKRLELELANDLGI